MKIFQKFEKGPGVSIGWTQYPKMAEIWKNRRKKSLATCKIGQFWGVFTPCGGQKMKIFQKFEKALGQFWIYPTYQKIIKIGLQTLELWPRTDRQTHKHTHRHTHTRTFCQPLSEIFSRIFHFARSAWLNILDGTATLVTLYRPWKKIWLKVWNPGGGRIDPE